MNTIFRNSILTAAVILGSTMNLFAFDGERKGFLLGFTAGASQTSYEHTATNPQWYYQTRPVTNKYPFKDSGAGWSTNFVMGYGFTNRFALQYTNAVSWFLKRRIEYPFGVSTINTNCLITYGISALAASYYLRDTAPSAYGTLGYGLSVWSTPFVSDYSPKAAPAIILSAGYEFSPHWSVELSLVQSNPTVGNMTTHATTIMVGLRGLAY